MPIEPLRPVETMNPYKPCWCGSDKKYKWCHHRREQQTPVNIFEIEARILEELRTGYCSYRGSGDDPCSPTIAKAHTVQRRGGLALIAEEGHVLTVKPTMKALIEIKGVARPRRIGVGNASVFPGFCGKHDTSLFKPVEGKSLSLDRESAFLFAYRAIAYERFAKEWQLRSTDIHREMDRGHPFWKQVIIQRHLHATLCGIRRGMEEIDRSKQAYDEALLSGSPDDFHYQAIRFGSVLPIVACTAFYPEYDFGGTQLQRLAHGDAPLEHLTLTVTAFQGETVVVFGWLGDAAGPAAALADSFFKTPDDRKADALLRLLFIQSDNLFLRQSWWEGLSEADQQRFCDDMMAGTGMRMRRDQDLVEDGKHFLLADVVETQRG